MIYPQEIEVWYVLPLIRKELSKELLNHNLNQKEIALKLGLTEAAVSQYLNEKRANERIFDKGLKNAVIEAARRIKDNRNVMKEIQNLSRLFWKTKDICKIHMQHDKSIPKTCEICFK
ncbi:MAG: hypothetical protein QT11_C0001G0699 [archaeon GW2011_AR20]|nr:MAG: hypothetical protein QT11_C0001G0699 [archaeon GW2011_AR20]MBS3160968.1 transcriptional regulator [Candidatus Woesearchaeota archaeon]